MELTYVTELSAIVGNKLTHLNKLIATCPDRLILRAKALSDEEYLALAMALVPLCEANGVKLILNHQVALARALDLPVQLSVHELDDSEGLTFGVSVHTLEEAKCAIAKGASWLVYGHLFPTASKIGLAPRSMEVFKEIIALGVPTYGIGGIKLSRLEALPEGMSGVYVMRDAMKADDIFAFTKEFKDALNKLKKD